MEALTLITEKSVVEERFSLNLEIDAECMELIKEAKRYSGKFKVAEVLKMVLKEYVGRKKPKVSKKKSNGRSSRILKPSRYIPRVVKDEVRTRDGEQCSYVAPNGRRCTEKVGLQLDHMYPYAKGGKNEASNLRLCCKAHNQLYAEQIFGRDYMIAKRTGS